MRLPLLVASALGAIVGLGVASQPVLSSTQSWYFQASALCYQADGSGGTMTKTGYYYVNTHSTTSSVARCPLMPNTNGSINYDDDVQVRAYLWDRHQSLDILCRVQVYDRDDTSVEGSSWESTSGYSNLSSMYMVVDFPNTSQTSVTGLAELYCIIPDRDASGWTSGIGQYRLYDNGPG